MIYNGKHWRSNIYKTHRNYKWDFLNTKWDLLNTRPYTEKGLFEYGFQQMGILDITNSLLSKWDFLNTD